MENITVEIELAYKKWMNKVSEVPDESWHDDYDKKSKSEKRHAKIFENLCIKNGLDYIKISSELFSRA